MRSDLARTGEGAPIDGRPRCTTPAPIGAGEKTGEAGRTGEAFRGSPAAGGAGRDSAAAAQTFIGYARSACSMMSGTQWSQPSVMR